MKRRFQAYKAEALAIRAAIPLPLAPIMDIQWRVR
jgi:hypothetical protein